MRVEALKIKTVEVQCTVIGDRPSYCIGGVRQEIGDRARLQLGDALGLVKVGKAKIIPNTEKFETLPIPPDPAQPKPWLRAVGGRW
jgi:hypothetical protein